MKAGQLEVSLEAKSTENVALNTELARNELLLDAIIERCKAANV